MSQRTLRVVRDVADDQAGGLACDMAGVVSSGLPTVPAAQVVRAQGTGAFVLDVRDLTIRFGAAAARDRDPERGARGARIEPGAHARARRRSG